MTHPSSMTPIPVGLDDGYAYTKLALPDGRLAETPLTDGISPSHGAERVGITGVIKSAAKVDHIAACNGTSLNIRLAVG